MSNKYKKTEKLLREAQEKAKATGSPVVIAVQKKRSNSFGKIDFDLNLKKSLEIMDNMPVLSITRSEEGPTTMPLKIQKNK